MAQKIGKVRLFADTRTGVMHRLTRLNCPITVSGSKSFEQAVTGALPYFAQRLQQ
jgi:hypothetical protein